MADQWRTPVHPLEDKDPIGLILPAGGIGKDTRELNMKRELIGGNSDHKHADAALRRHCSDSVDWRLEKVPSESMQETERYNSCPDFARVARVARLSRRL
jgi:hypothetical protein